MATDSSPTEQPLPGRSLLLASEIFSSEGGIPRILQAYLMALGELAGAGHQPRLVALNDRDFRAAADSGWAVPDSSQWAACGRGKLRFVREVLRLSRDCERIVCGHVRQLSVAWLAQRLRPQHRMLVGLARGGPDGAGK